MVSVILKRVCLTLILLGAVACGGGSKGGSSQQQSTPSTEVNKVSDFNALKSDRDCILEAVTRNEIKLLNDILTIRNVSKTEIENLTSPFKNEVIKCVGDVRCLHTVFFATLATVRISTGFENDNIKDTADKIIACDNDSSTASLLPCVFPLGINLVNISLDNTYEVLAKLRDDFSNDLQASKNELLKEVGTCSSKDVSCLSDRAIQLSIADYIFINALFGNEITSDELNASFQSCGTSVKKIFLQD